DHFKGWPWFTILSEEAHVMLRGRPRGAYLGLGMWVKRSEKTEGNLLQFGQVVPEEHGEELALVLLRQPRQVSRPRRVRNHLRQDGFVPLRVVEQLFHCAREFVEDLFGIRLAVVPVAMHIRAHEVTQTPDPLLPAATHIGIVRESRGGGFPRLLLHIANDL